MSSPLDNSIPPLKWAKKGRRDRPAQPSPRYLVSGGSDSRRLVKSGESSLKFRIRIGKSNYDEPVADKKDEASLPQKHENPCHEAEGVSTEMVKAEKPWQWDLRPRGKKGEAKKVQENRTQDPTAKIDAPKKQPGKFSISLTPEEIEADFLMMTGSKPPKKPKKRPRTVQRKLDTLFPATELPSSVTTGDYI